jgi:hypothetical protein
MPCEELVVRQKLAKELGIVNKHPLLLLRYGYAEKCLIHTEHTLKK